ncbi:polysaccharide lyase family 7 protein [Pseudomonas sp. RTC3]|uniref:polysaccharide lyase family 7 protein n=1 Tax=unclassified Pseudomonas TaxID=196821 RepID=UPI002AB596C1|nr:MULTISPECIES: polysaccharide lyase family 7 protein [unclassified Pseudomonas]MEB0063916.1 polysaccharide lyase family 7 protein [Pseudomonas sp. RTC3]MDY7567681.1 polysaccharide lyase family 7 protein [Pseudomonas sp. 5C2]MEB0007697.1 polysaccharide lyase family 7 protein [Pseudomonas sp. RTB2]MEB0018696.1 polysaccharide lyase family 7 protein [Pseudomonas sp. RTB3]MEB0026728.1 polysaccharide lyase family 7 protein [Pseudomonas sp. MH9.2]
MIDLASWNLSIPVGSPPATIDTPKLVDGYNGKYFHADTGTLFFWAPVTGSRTANAKYPRSELRETYSNGTLHNWLYPSGDHFLRATLAVNQVPSSGRIVIGQIHAYESTEPLLKVEYQYKDATKSGIVVAKVRNRFDDQKSRVIIIAENVPLNEQFKYIIHLSPGGDLGVSVRDANWSSPISATWRDKPLYFKAGVYAQDNSGYTNEGGMATFYKLDIDHN